jgi:hypothetical protein
MIRHKLDTRWLDNWEVGMSGDTVCDLHHTHEGDEKHGFPV